VVHEDREFGGLVVDGNEEDVPDDVAFRGLCDQVLAACDDVVQPLVDPARLVGRQAIGGSPGPELVVHARERGPIGGLEGSDGRTGLALIIHG
jgi:hypothetical protein